MTIPTIPSPDEFPGKGDPLAKRFFTLLKNAPRSEQIRALNALSAGTSGSERADTALAGLRAYTGATGQLPTKNAYERWRIEQTPARQWPSATFIANSFGSWAKAAAALGCGVAPDVEARALLATGSAATPDEVEAALRAYANAHELSVLSFTPYQRWAIQAMRDPGRALLRIPCARHVFVRTHGSWRAAVESIGLTAGQSDGRPGGARGPATEYRVDRLNTLLNAWGSSRKTAELTMERFDHWRRSGAASSDELIPTAATIAAAFGSWPRALQEAGLMTPAQAQASAARHGRRGLTDDQLLAYAREARSAGDDKPMTRAAFAAWRDSHSAKHTIPSEGAFRLRFGTWTDVNRRLDQQENQR